MLAMAKGIAEARDLLSKRRVGHEQAPSKRTIESIRRLFGRELSPQEVVQRILDDVRSDGDEALQMYTKLIEGIHLERLEIPKVELRRAWDALPQELAGAFELAAERVREFNKMSLPKSWIDSNHGLGEMITPIERVGIYIPGGTASYPSTVLMNVIPAKIAGVDEVIICSPSRDGNLPESSILAAAYLADVDRVFQIGGAQAIAAMAYGTTTVPRVDKICGPGNIFVNIAKLTVFGQVGVDGIYGPTETIVIADDSADPVLCAADLLAQAEHDELSCPIFITTSPELAQRVLTEIERQLAHLARRKIASIALDTQGCIITTDDIEEAISLSNEVGPEHLCLLVRDPWSFLSQIRNAGGIFLGEKSPEVMGDYVAGPSHTMPTGGTAKFNSYLGVQQFLKTIPVVGIRNEDVQELAEAASLISRAEGFTGHAMAAELRQSNNGTQRSDE